MTRRARSGQHGTTLIEMLIALVVLVVAAGAMAMSISVAQSQAEEARGRLLALQAARSVIENIKDTAVDNLLTIDTSTYLPQGLADAAIDLATNPAAPAGQDLVTATVTVSWTGPRGRAMSLRLSTMRSRY